MTVHPVRASDPGVAALVAALTEELASAGYAADESFGYSLDQLEASDVHLVGAFVDDELVGIGGVEVAGETAELKRFYVSPGHRGRGVADAVIGALLDQLRSTDVRTIRLETGDRQHAAMAFYGRHGFEVVPRFGPYVDSATSVCMQRPVDRPPTYLD